jgi:hypothetical protein
MQKRNATDRTRRNPNFQSSASLHMDCLMRGTYEEPLTPFRQRQLTSLDSHNHSGHGSRILVLYLCAGNQQDIKSGSESQKILSGPMGVYKRNFLLSVLPFSFFTPTTHFKDRFQRNTKLGNRYSTFQTRQSTTNRTPKENQSIVSYSCQLDNFLIVAVKSHS